MRNELLATDDDALQDIVRIGNGFNPNLDPPLPKPINRATFRQALLRSADDAARQGLATAGAT